jgi:hypothetical protein
MGIRGVDIQVAIQRAAEADKIEQGQTSQIRASDAGARELAELERLKKQEQPQKTERSGQLSVHRDKEQENSASSEEKDPSKPSLDPSETSSDNLDSVVTPDGHVDILV